MHRNPDEEALQLLGETEADGSATPMGMRGGREMRPGGLIGGGYGSGAGVGAGADVVERLGQQVAELSAESKRRDYEMLDVIAALQASVRGMEQRQQATEQAILGELKALRQSQNIP